MQKPDHNSDSNSSPKKNSPKKKDQEKQQQNETSNVQPSTSRAANEQHDDTVTPKESKKRSRGATGASDNRANPSKKPSKQALRYLAEGRIPIVSNEEVLFKANLLQPNQPRRFSEHFSQPNTISYEMLAQATQNASLMSGVGSVHRKPSWFFNKKSGKSSKLTAQVVDSWQPWGTLYFYRSGKLISSLQLSGYGEIVISNRTQFIEYDSNDDWHVFLGEGFTLKKSPNGLYVDMRGLDTANKYKVFSYNNTIDVKGTEIFQVFNGNEFEANLSHVRNFGIGHDMGQQGNVFMAVHGNFFGAMGMSNDVLSMSDITYEMATMMPYTMCLKINEAFLMVDHLLMSLICHAAMETH